MSMKDTLLGQPHGTATNKLRKMVMFGLLQKLGQDLCYQCGLPIESVDDLSLDHKTSWQKADDPRAAFFDLENIAFSHLSCNIKAAEKAPRQTHCKRGHPLDGENTYVWTNGRCCKTCKRERNKRYMAERRRLASRAGL